ncbi:MAG TPA: hypothetical protein VEY67_12850 [Candidatus Dormibacteraeota bacterium]|nr:hypothetical protein [Candidatus Dormibacteraeota bacterium]
MDDETVVRRERVVPAVPARGDVGAERVERVDRYATGPRPDTLLRRIIALIFGLIQLVIVLRIILLLLDAREANGIVRGILDISQVFVAPFNGIFNTDALARGGSVLDIAAIAALIGWTILELVLLAVANIARPSEA